MAHKYEHFETYDGNGVPGKVFDVTGDVSTASASWKAVQVTSGTPTTITATPSVGSYDPTTGKTPVTLTLTTSDTNGKQGTYNHELVLTIAAVPVTVATGKLYVHASIVT